MRYSTLILRNKKIVDNFRLSNEQLKELERREKEYKLGKGKSYSWEEVEKHLKQLIDNRKNHKSQF